MNGIDNKYPVHDGNNNNDDDDMMTDKKEGNDEYNDVGIKDIICSVLGSGDVFASEIAQYNIYKYIYIYKRRIKGKSPGIYTRNNKQTLFSLLL